MKRKNGKVKMDAKPGKKDKIKEQAVIMKGNKKIKESNIIYGHTIKADGGVTVLLHSLKLGMR